LFKTRKSAILLASIVSIVMMIAGCTATPSPAASPTSKPATTTPSNSPATTTTPTPQVITKDATYNVLNPSGTFIPIQTKGLAPRLDTMDGKTVWVSQTEADPVIMPALYARLQKDYPKTTWKTNMTGSTSPVRLTAEEQAGCQAMIMGNAW
jgi:hypothetical protein